MLVKSFNPVSAPVSSAPVLLSSTPFFEPTSGTTAGSSAPLLPLESYVEEMAVLSAEYVSSVLAEVSAPQVSSVDPDISMSAAMTTNLVSTKEPNSVSAPLLVMKSADFLNVSVHTSVGLLPVASNTKVRNFPFAAGSASQLSASTLTHRPRVSAGVSPSAVQPLVS